MAELLKLTVGIDLAVSDETAALCCGCLRSISMLTRKRP